MDALLYGADVEEKAFCLLLTSGIVDYIINNR